MVVSLDKQTWQDAAAQHVAKTQRPLLTILGPTASGKTALSMELALMLQQEHGWTSEVVNADSRQLYRGLDIGTAKITQEEMQGVEHHLLDVLDPREEATAGWYQKEAMQCIDAIHLRGNVPLLVGGSMLYLASITDGLTLAPTQVPEIRERLLKEYDADAGETLYKRLLSVDPEAAHRVHRNNKERLVRAVEICELIQKANGVPRDELRSADATCPYDLLILGISKPRSSTVFKIDNRTKAMMEVGWIEEVQGLLDQGYTASDPGMKSHGYREIIQYLQNGEPGSLEELTEQISAKTRQYAKRQVTWWKGDSRIHWVGAS